MVHLEAALVFGCVVACPYLIIQLYGFVAPALYKQERRYSVMLIGFGVVLFALGGVAQLFCDISLCVPLPKHLSGA